MAEEPDREELAAVVDNFVTLMRTFTKARSHWMSQAEQDVEKTTHMVLRFVAHEGPVRATSIAESLHSDPSTVSRQVAALIKDGLLERRADQGDGRASLLVITTKAQTVLAEHDEIRLNHFAEMLAGWSNADLAQFASLLAKFTIDFDHASTSTMISEKAANRGRSAGRNA